MASMAVPSWYGRVPPPPYQLGTAIDAVGLPHLQPAGAKVSRSLGQT